MLHNIYNLISTKIFFMYILTVNSVSTYFNSLGVSRKFALDAVLTPSVVGLSLECRTVRESFLSSYRHLNPPCRASVARPERFRALSPACTVLSRKIYVLHLPLNEFTHEMLHLLFVLCIYCL
jgi:hypothetical protein